MVRITQLGWRERKKVDLTSLTGLTTLNGEQFDKVRYQTRGIYTGRIQWDFAGDKPVKNDLSKMDPRHRLVNNIIIICEPFLSGKNGTTWGCVLTERHQDVFT